MCLLPGQAAGLAGRDAAHREHQQGTICRHAPHGHHPGTQGIEALHGTLRQAQIKQRQRKRQMQHPAPQQGFERDLLRAEGAHLQQHRSALHTERGTAPALPTNRCGRRNRSRSTPPAAWPGRACKRRGQQQLHSLPPAGEKYSTKPHNFFGSLPPAEGWHPAARRRLLLAPVGGAGKTPVCRGHGRAAPPSPARQHLLRQTSTSLAVRLPQQLLPQVRMTKGRPEQMRAGSRAKALRGQAPAADCLGGSCAAAAPPTRPMSSTPS